MSAPNQPDSRRSLSPALVAAIIFVLGLTGLAGIMGIAMANDGGEPIAAAATAAHGSAADDSTPAGPAHKADEVIPSHHASAPSEPPAEHDPYPAALPPLEPGNEHSYTIALKDVTIEIAPGVKYSAWTFAGGAPGPTIHVKQGDKVTITLRNDGAIPHSIDFHAARIAPNRAFKDVASGESITYSFTASDPGVFMYHCGTPPVLAHIANGMYGAIVVDPKGGLPKVDRAYVLVGSEWYLSNDGKTAPASVDMVKARHVQPDYVTWNGYFGQYKDNPLQAEVGETVRFYVVAAGPSFDVDFHIVGTLLDKAWLDGTTEATFKNIQTVLVPAGGGAVFDTHFDEDGLYPFVSHSFASVDLGQVGLVKVGDVKGTMSH